MLLELGTPIFILTDIQSKLPNADMLTVVIRDPILISNLLTPVMSLLDAFCVLRASFRRPVFLMFQRLCAVVTLSHCAQTLSNSFESATLLQRMRKKPSFPRKRLTTLSSIAMLWRGSSWHVPLALTLALLELPLMFCNIFVFGLINVKTLIALITVGTFSAGLFQDSTG
jgi:hypothetical protein